MRKMARCPHCNEILEDAWLKKIGATLMGKQGGSTKVRPRPLARKAAKARWKMAKKESL